MNPPGWLAAINLFAVDRFTITTLLDDAEIHRRLEEVIVPRTVINYALRIHSTKPCIGRVTADGFRAERISLWLESGPRATGRFWNDGRFTYVEMSIAQQWPSMVLPALILAAFVDLIIWPYGSPAPSLLEYTATLLICSAAFLFRTIPYTREVPRTGQFFRDLLEDIQPQGEP